MSRAFFLSLLLFVSCSGQNSTPANKPPATIAPAEQAVKAAPIAPVNTESLSATEFAKIIERVSEANGYFDTDNLISNESSYLHVMNKMRSLNVTGGAYIGVGPDQNFSYIAQIRPHIAFISDIRRDNLLQHLFFKSLFSLANNRVEYLCLLFGKPLIMDGGKWDINQIAAAIDKSSSNQKQFEETHTKVAAKLKTFGLKLDEKDFATIKNIHQAFFEGGLDLKFTSHNRAPRPYYPDYRGLMLERDLTGKQCNYLVNEDDYQFVRSLSQRNLIIPVVGNLAGDKALLEIGKILQERGEKVSAIYTSNVEYYLMGDDSFDRFAASVKRLPLQKNSVMIRSVFMGGYGRLPQNVPGYYSTQMLQPLESFIKGSFRSYSDLISQDSLELK